MSEKSLDNLFKEIYPNLAQQLKKAGLTTLSSINEKVFNENELYFFEVLGYSIDDNERIKNILRKENTEDVLESFILSSAESRFGSDLFKSLMLILAILTLIIALIFFIVKTIIT